MQTEKSMVRQLGLGKWVSQWKDQQKCTGIDNTITVQMCRVNNNNNKRCTGTSDENHCAPSKTTDVSSRQTALLQGQTTIINKQIGEHENDGKACNSTEKCNGFTLQQTNKL